MIIAILNMEWSSFLNGLLGLVINPLFYWFIIYAFLISVIRVRRERKQFGVKLTPLFAEISRTFFISLAGFAIITVVFMYLELSLSVEVIILLITVTIVLTGLEILSATYILGLTFILLMTAVIADNALAWGFFTPQMVNANIFSALAVLIGIFLILEAVAITDEAPKYPEKMKSRRGLYSAHYRLKRLIFMPFFTFVPVTGTFSEIPFLPYLVTDTKTYIILLVPFFFGFNYKVASEFTETAAVFLRKRTLILGLIVLAISFASIAFSYLSMLAVLIGIIGREWIVYQQNKKNHQSKNVFIPTQNGLKILKVIEDGLGEEIGLYVGDTILKVNFEAVDDPQAFHEALHKNTISFKLEVENPKGEKRFVHGSMKDRQSEGFGLVFANVNSYSK